MTARTRGQREAAGMAPDRQTLSRANPGACSRFIRALSAWIAGPVLVMGGVTLNSALADQHSAPHQAAPHFSAPHNVTPHYASPHYATPGSTAQRGFSAPPRTVSPQSFRQVAPSMGNHPTSYFAPNISNERAFAGQPARPFTPQPNQMRPAYPGNRPATGQPGNGQGNGEHLGSWMRQHQNQSLADQERALRQEQGFNRLAPQQQQNLVNRLHQLDQMPPAQRERTMQRVENMERLSPERRQAVRSSAQQLGALPEGRKRMVQKAFRDLREMPPEQRNAVMNSPQFGGQFSAQERSIMGNLLTVEPYQHNGASPTQPQYGK